MPTLGDVIKRDRRRIDRERGLDTDGWKVIDGNKRTPTRPSPAKSRISPDQKKDLLNAIEEICDRLDGIERELIEIKESMIVFGFKFKKTKELAEVGLRYRKKGRERMRRHKERHGK